MAKNEYRLLVYSFLIALILNFALYGVLHREHKKVAVVDAVRLFNEYNMKKELEGNASKTLHYYENQLDSVKKEFQMHSNNPEDAKRLAQTYQTLEANLDGEYKAGNAAINEQVWKRLNPILEQYGKDHGLHLIIGANGMGTVLYNDDYFDRTNDVIQFANKKYESGS